MAEGGTRVVVFVVKVQQERFDQGVLGKRMGCCTSVGRVLDLLSLPPTLITPKEPM